jgi:hypothetical protein
MTDRQIDRKYRREVQAGIPGGADVVIYRKSPGIPADDDDDDEVAGIPRLRGVLTHGAIAVFAYWIGAFVR